MNIYQSVPYLKPLLTVILLVVDATTSAVEETVQTAATVDAVIGPALQQGVIPVIDVATDIAVVSTAVRHISFVLRYSTLTFLESSRPSVCGWRLVSQRVYVCIISLSGSL